MGNDGIGRVEALLARKADRLKHYQNVVVDQDDLRELLSLARGNRDASVELRNYVLGLIERQRDERGDYLYRGDADASLLKVVELLDRLSPEKEPK